MKTLQVFILPASSQPMSYPLIEVPPETAEHFLEKGKNKRRMVVHFPNGTKFHRALQRNKDGFCYITLGKSTLRDAKVEPGMYVDIQLEIDTSEFGMPFPEEMQEVLAQDPEGNAAFLALKPGLRRSLLYYISSAKSVDTRIKRSLEMVERMKTGDLHGQ